MKLPKGLTRTPMVSGEGRITPVWDQWLTRLIDSPIREVSDSAASPTAPVMKKGEYIIFKCTNTGVNKTYIVYYDGDDRYYWLCDSTNLY